MDSTELPVDSIPNSITGAAFNISEITSESPSGSPSESASVAPAPAGLGSRPSSPTDSAHSLSGDAQSHAASVAASLRKIGVNVTND